MNVYVFDSLSLLEGIYLLSIYEEGKVNLVFNLADADVVVGCNAMDLFYDKTIIINNNSFDQDHLIELSKFNKIISRFPLNSINGIEIKVEPYEEVKLNNFAFDGTTRNVLSRLSIKDFLIIKSEGIYKMKKPQMFANKDINGNKSIIGLLYDQVS